MYAVADRNREDQLARKVYAVEFGRVVLANTVSHGNHPVSSTSRLNARWVETLMGVPVGWTMPSCASPVTIEPTSCDSSVMASYQQPLS
jgi:hypothetical protein